VDKQNIIDSLINFRTLLVGSGTEIPETSIYVSRHGQDHMSIHEVVQHSSRYYHGRIRRTFQEALKCAVKMIDLRREAELTRDRDTFMSAVAMRDQCRICIDKLIGILSKSEEDQVMFDELMNDEITVTTADGNTYTRIPASVQHNKIFTERTEIPIRAGDRITCWRRSIRPHF